MMKIPVPFLILIAAEGETGKLTGGRQRIKFEYRKANILNEVRNEVPLLLFFH